METRTRRYRHSPSKLVSVGQGEKALSSKSTKNRRCTSPPSGRSIGCGITVLSAVHVVTLLARRVIRFGLLAFKTGPSCQLIPEVP